MSVEQFHSQEVQEDSKYQEHGENFEAQEDFKYQEHQENFENRQAPKNSEKQESKESLEKMERNKFLKTEVRAKKLLKLGYPLETDVFKLKELDFPQERGLAVQFKNDENPKTNTAIFKFNKFSNSPEQKGNMSAVDSSEISQLVHSHEADAFFKQKAVTPEQIEKEVYRLRRKEIYDRLTTLKRLEFFEGKMSLDRIGEKSITLKKKGRQTNEVFSLREMGPDNYLCQKIDVDKNTGKAITTNLPPKEGFKMIEDIAFAPESTKFINRTLDDREQAERKTIEETNTIESNNKKAFERIIRKLDSIGIDKYEVDKRDERVIEKTEEGVEPKSFKIRRSGDKLIIRPHKDYARKNQIFTIELSHGHIDRLGYDGKISGDNAENQERLSRVEHSLDTKISQKKQENESKERAEADQKFNQALETLA